jgi:hypothetical protein
MSKTLVAGVSALALMVVWGGPAFAQQAKCLAGKTKCMSKKATGLLKCHQKAEPGNPADPEVGECVTKVVGKFDGGATPTRGCFEKLENKSPNDCITLDDAAAAEAAAPTRPRAASPSSRRRIFPLTTAGSRATRARCRLWSTTASSISPPC